MKALAEMLSRNNTLVELYLCRLFCSVGDNNIKDAEVGTLAAGLLANHSLTKLDLSNHVSSGSVESLQGGGCEGNGANHKQQQKPDHTLPKYPFTPHRLQRSQKRRRHRNSKRNEEQ